MLDSIFRSLLNISSPNGGKGKLHIFIFHRVLDNPDPLFPGEPDCARFDQIASILSALFNVIPLAEAVDRLKNNDLPSRAACITFDDGYRDNYTNALPILRKYNLPATVFIATDYIQGETMWNDVVIESIRSYSGRVALSDVDVIAESCASVKQKRDLIQKIIPQIKYMPQAKRSEMVKAIADQCAYQPKQLMMCEKEVLALRDGGVSIGAHTCSHPILMCADNQDAKLELSKSKEVLEALLKDKVSLFAYPNGKPGEDYSARDVELVKKLGFKAAVSTTNKVATCSDSIYELPRFTPWDTQRAKFMLRCFVESVKA